MSQPVLDELKRIIEDSEVCLYLSQSKHNDRRRQCPEHAQLQKQQPGGPLRGCSNGFLNMHFLTVPLCFSPFQPPMQIMKEDDSNWPAPDRVGRQELEVVMGSEHISFATTKLGSLLQVQSSNDPEGLRVFYYLVQVRGCSRAMRVMRV